MIGYIGYCNTMLSVGGYHNVGGENFWPQFPTYKGGTVNTWATSSGKERWWATFLLSLEEYGVPDALWWEVGAHNLDSELQTLELDSITVYSRIREQYAGDIYISGMSDYDTETRAAINDSVATGPAAAIRDRMIMLGFCLLGPVMPVMTLDNTRENDPVHPNAKGQRQCGRVLRNFFTF